MNFTKLIVQQTIRRLKTRLNKAKRDHANLAHHMNIYTFEAYLIRELAQRAESHTERDYWELEQAALECISSSESQEMDMLANEIKHCETLHEAAKRHPCA